MPRYAVKITLEEFKGLIEAETLKGVGNWEDNSYWLTDKIKNDLKKVEFDWENFSPKRECYYYKEQVMGFQQRGDLVFLGCYAGEDGHTPIYFVIYYDGKQLRGYIPKKGNLWNFRTKQAFGMNERADIDLIWDEWTLPNDPGLEPEDKWDMADSDPHGLLDLDAMIEDVVNRIQVRG
jgi:hypothetical protein